MIPSLVNVLSTAIKANAAMRAIVEAVLELEDSAATGVVGGDMMKTRGTTEMGKPTKFMMNMFLIFSGLPDGIVGSNGNDELGLEDAFSRPQRSIRLEIRFQGPQSPDAYGVSASQIIQSGQGKICPMEYLQRAREGVGAKDKGSGSGGGMDKESVNK
ncbi:hypothetical protein F5051DRAFT_432074 [Lentinula edodes]|nr:hypothetical protein F5051DRAFT_432074 [Lentinula edodes]